MADNQEIFTDDEQEKIILQLALGQGTFTEDDGAFALAWMRKAKIGACLVDMVLAGKLVYAVQNNDLIFRQADKGG